MLDLGWSELLMIAMITVIVVGPRELPRVLRTVTQGMAPLVRNAGEALGVSAYLNTTAPDDEFRFASSIDYKNLIWIEEALSGPPPAPAEKLQGLLSPSWPAEFPKIDEAMMWGVIIGTYSSIFVAVPLLLYLRPRRGDEDEAPHQEQPVSEKA